MVKPPAVVASLLLLVAFVLGAASGGAVTYGFVKRQQVELLDEGGRGLVEARRLHALIRKLDLDDAQQTRIAAILEANREARHAIDQDVMSRCGERLYEHRAKLDDEIRAVLRADQVARYDELIAKRRKKMNKKRGD